MAMKFIHLTDTHLLPSGEMFHGLDPQMRLQAAVASIRQDHGDATFLVMTGDLTNDGALAAYDVLGKELAPLEMPVHLMVGNHDSRTNLLKVLPETPLDDAGFLQTTFLTPEGRFVLLDTLDPGHEAGKLCDARLEWLQHTLALDDAPVFLFMHHPPLKVGLNGMDSIRLTNSEAFYDTILRHIPKIRHLFFGHLHRPLWGTWRGLSYSCMRGLNHQMALDLTSPAGDFFGNTEPPAYGVVLIDIDQVTVHMHDFTNSGASFQF